MDLASPCPICSTDYSKRERVTIIIDGREEIVPSTFQGPLDWAPYLMLQLMHREWTRAPVIEEQCHARPSSQALIVLLFWTYFETLMSWYYERSTSALPTGIQNDILNRYASIGSRCDRLHRMLFGCRYWDDLESLGYTAVRNHLETVQSRRNAFTHGKPEAISDLLVSETVLAMPRFHEAWIKSFNLRCATTKAES
jgi:hypothetical protein